MSNRNSRLILAKGIKLNKKYTEVLSYSEQEMITLLRTNIHLVSETSNFSFLRPYNNRINVDLPINIVMQSNYMAFQNPDFSNKWYFAFIDERKYISDKTTEITYTIDYFSTWFDYWNPKTCFILRQHATNDTVGSNLIPENFDLGEYVANGNSKSFTEFNSFETYVQVSEKTDENAPGLDNRGGVFINDTLLIDDVKMTNEFMTLKQLLDTATNSSRKVLNAWLVPSALVPSSPIPVPSTGRIVDTTGVESLNSITVPNVSSLDSYVPANRKLLTFPYIYIALLNNSGRSNILHYEKFTGSKQIAGKMVLTPGCPGLVYPKNYAGITDNISEGVSTADIPVVAYESDSYKEWLASNTFARKSSDFESVTKLATGGGALALGLGMLNPTALAIGGALALSGMSNAFESMITDKQAQLLPNSYYNNNGNGNILHAWKKLSPIIQPMSITRNKARQLDEFFTRYGYATNELELPNITHRSNYNYIRVSSDSTPCIINNHNNITIPQNDLDIINNLFRNGITIWHNHTNLGDYSVSNTIV